MTRRVARLTDRLLAHLASRLERVASQLHDRAGTRSHTRAETDAAPADGDADPPDHWVALLRQRAPHLLRGGMRTYQAAAPPRSTDLPAGPGRWPMGAEVRWPHSESPSGAPTGFHHGNTASGEPPPPGYGLAGADRPAQPPAAGPPRGDRVLDAVGHPLTPPPASGAVFASPSPPPRPDAEFPAAPPQWTPPPSGRIHDDASARPQGLTPGFAAPRRVQPTPGPSEPRRGEGHHPPRAPVEPSAPGEPRTAPGAAPAGHAADRPQPRGPDAPPGGLGHGAFAGRSAQPDTDRRADHGVAFHAGDEPQPPRFPAQPAANVTVPPQWVGEHPGEPGQAVFPAPRDAERLWPELPPSPVTAGTRELDDAAHVAKLEREQEGS